MGGRLTFLALLGACSFSAPVESGDPGSAPPDLPDPSDPGDPVDPCIVGYLDLCSQSAPTEPLLIEASEAIDTDTDPRCRTVAQTNGRPICLVYATEVAIGTDATLRATGSRPLAIASTSTITISGTIDVSSQRATGQVGPGADDACVFTQVPQNDAGGGGGAAGGTFATLGGNGGIGDNDDSIGNDGIAMPGVRGSTMGMLVLRGGCRGQRGGHESSYGGGGDGGRGGHGGGALYLYAEQVVEISGAIRATGAGGEGGDAQAGGGGGGSGGHVVIESALIRISGRISANGGGGGEGGGKLIGPVTAIDVPGTDGSDGALGLVAAPGGSSDDPRWGYGGAGGAGTTSATDGTSSLVGGGGGGGSVGVIALIGTREITGELSPPPQ